MTVYEGSVCPPGKGYIAIVVSKFNRTITQRLLDGALHKLKEHKVDERDIQVCWVPGAFEIPLLARRFALDMKCSAVICLGAVIKGETPHDEHINRAVSLELARAGTDTGTPVIFGMLTCNTVEQAEARSGLRQQSRDKAVDPTAGNKGAEAAETALEMIDLMTELPEMDGFGAMDMFSSFMRQMTNEDDFDEDDFDEDDDLQDDYYGGIFGSHLPYEEPLVNESQKPPPTSEDSPSKKKQCKKKKK